LFRMMHLVHDVPGRLRFSSTTVKGDPRYAAALRRQVRLLGGVTQASLNPITGGMIVHYETGGGTREAILRGLEALIQGPIVAVPRRVSGGVPAPARQHPELAEIIADMLAGRLVELAVRMMVAALI
jgi:hypothetical protein